MSDSIDQATSAFSAAIGKSASSRADSNDDGPSDVMFGSLGDSENDVDAGGDYDAAPEDSSEADDVYNPYDELGGNEDKDADDDTDDDTGEDADKEDGDSDDAGEEDSLMSREFLVMVDGQELKVPLREALDGYIRTKTFHQRMNQLDQVHKQVEAYAGNVAADRQRVDQMLSEAEELIQGVMPKEPDWDLLFSQDPRAARDLQVQFNQFNNRLVEIRNRRAAAAREQQERATREQVEFAKAEMPKFFRAAGFRTKEEADKGIQAMRRTAINAGFSEQEVAGVLDSRMLNILLKASKYDAIISNKPKAVSNGKTPVKPGTVSRSGSVRKGIQGATKNHARSGTVDSAADVFAKML